MLTPLLWALICAQMAMGLFDIALHHELSERLAWRVSQKAELRLHAVRNFAYAGVFAVFGGLELHGVWAWLLLAVLAAEVVITLMDFVEEDRSRRLPATERVTHALLALNYGAILALLAPRLVAFAAQPTAIVVTSYGVFSLLAGAGAVGCFLFGLREAAAAVRIDRLPRARTAALAAALPERQRILVTGATGFIGARLVGALTKAGHEVTALVRDPAKIAGGAPLIIVTNLRQIPDDARIDAIVNLAGEPISNGLWTVGKRRAILRSRLGVTRDVRRLIARLETKPAVLVSGSAIGWYGLRDDQILDETGDHRPCFSHRLCAAWERAAKACEVFGVRVVTLRTGVVLGIDGGMLSQLLVPFEFGLGGRIGHGRQWLSWIEHGDMVRLIVHVIATDSLTGPVNATAPQPVRNGDFARLLGLALSRPALLPAPGFLLRLALGDFADELLLCGQRVLPAKALASGFRFEHPDLLDMLETLVGKPRRPARMPARQAQALPAEQFS